MEKKESRAEPGQATRRGVGALLLIALALLAAGALSVPFVYESQTLWYKVGYEKTLLRAGQLAGLLAAVSLFVQVLLGVRGRFLEAIYGVPHLTRWHRSNGMVLLTFALLHATLVLSVEQPSILLALKAWPELVGGALLLFILTMVVSSLLRRQIGLVYARWQLIHRLLAYLVPLLLAGHVLFVSDSFAGGLPKFGLLILLAGLAAAIVLIKLGRRERA